jgi:hypothetical protein
MTLILQLTGIPADRASGVYVIGGVAGRLPDRARFLYPAAADSYLGPLNEVVVVSDMFRSAESSLAAVRSGRGARAPGFSGHNYGLSLDLDVRATMRRLGVRSKTELDEWMEKAGWYCYRRDHAMTSLKGECHHFNFLGVGTEISPKVRSTSRYLEARIVSLYGDGFRLGTIGAQRALEALSCTMARSTATGNRSRAKRAACSSAVGGSPLPGSSMRRRSERSRMSHVVDGWIRDQRTGKATRGWRGLRDGGPGSPATTALEARKCGRTPNEPERRQVCE